tara:strand:- start:15845 stop:16726 length:882 start_codon:yes stop_codon:yes gene_type:complete
MEIGAKTGAKDSIFWPKPSLKLGAKLYSLDHPLIMGILNISPDSFYDGGRYENRESILHQVKKMREEGADIIDIGAASSRPGASIISPKEEIKRLEPSLKLIREEFPDQIVSVDTFHSETAKASADFGAHMINDISGGIMDPLMVKTMGKLDLPYIMMHMQGQPQNMQDSPKYENLLGEICYFFSEQIAKFQDAGLKDIILDPGFGFGKTLEHNYELLAKFEEFHIFEKPLLVGLSRKSMIYKLLENDPENALNGTTVAHSMALQKGAHILRVHDVRAAKEAAKIVTFTQNLT